MYTTHASRSVFALAAICGLFAAASNASAAVLVKYDFDSAATPFADVIGTPVLSVTALNRGTQLDVDDGRSTASTPPDGGAGSYFARGASLNQASNVTATAFGTAQSNGAYLTFTMTVPTGYELTLTKLGFDVARSSGNTQDMRVLATSTTTGDTFNDRLDINETTTGANSLVDVLQSNLGEIGTVVAGLNTNWGVADNTMATLGAPFAGITTVTFRIYAFTINNVTFNNANVIRFDNVFVEGTLALVPAPAALPAGLAMLGLMGARRRRRRAIRR